VYEGERLIKPALSPGGETVFVVNSICNNGDKGKRASADLLFPGIEERSEPLSWGTELKILGGPRDLYRKDEDDGAAAELGREWWFVNTVDNTYPMTGGVPAIADFSFYYQQMYVAPAWYRDRSPDVQVAAQGGDCP
jgi:hypothetical protein